MTRIYIGGAGGAPANNFIRSLRESKRKDYLIGASCVPADLFLASVDECHAILPARHANYRVRLLALVRKTKPDFIHAQHDFEVQALSNMRDELSALGVKSFLPRKETVDLCVNKFLSYERWKSAGIRVPETLMLHTSEDLLTAFSKLGGRVWLRAVEGGGGSGALPTSNLVFAQRWIELFKGWGRFSASAMLTPRSITFLSLWHEGSLIVAQTRRRRSWNFGDRTLSGVTGITGVGETCSDKVVTEVSLKSIQAIDRAPHGIFGVDLTYDDAGVPNPTEINIGRFFTTHYFFTKAGLNLPEIYVNIAMDGNFPTLTRTINPLPDGLVWIRGMDVEPVLTTAVELERFEKMLENEQNYREGHL